MVWFYADPHFCHEAAISFKGRGFESVIQMNKALIEKYNLVVQDNDTCYILGDYYFGSDFKELRALTSRLHGKKILVRGNHDTFSPAQYCSCGFSKYYDLPILLGADLLLSHEPVTAITGDGLVNIHGHTHGREFALQSAKHFCVSAECIDLRPISYREIQKRKGMIYDV